MRDILGGSLVVGAAVLAVPLFVACAVAFSLWESYVIWCLYGWHIVPLGAPPVPFAAVAAADMIVSLMTTHLMPEREKAWVLWVRPLGPALALAVGSWLR